MGLGRRAQSSETKRGKIVEVLADGSLKVMFDDGTEENVPASWLESTELPAYRCAPGSCVDGGCIRGHTGRLCGLCDKAINESSSTFFSWSGTECVECDAANSSGVALIITLALLLPPLYLATVCRPLLQSSGLGLGRCVAAAATLGEKVSEALEFAPSEASRMQVAGFLKILVSYWQVVSSFVNTFTIDWPARILTLLQLGAIFNIDIITLPGTACALSPWDFTTKLTVYTVTPLVSLTILAVPSLGAWVHRQRGGNMGDAVYQTVLSHFWYYALVFSFLAFPVVSVQILRSFSCSNLGRLGSWLRSDLEEACPTPTSFAFVYSSAFTVLWVFGLPLATLALLFYFQVPRMARQKLKAGRLQAVLARFAQLDPAASLHGREMHHWWDKTGDLAWKADPVSVLPTRLLRQLLGCGLWGGERPDEEGMVRALVQKLRTDAGQDQPEGDEGTELSSSAEKIAGMSRDELEKQVMALAGRLVESQLVAAVPSLWNSEFGEVEALTLARAGFLLSIYKVDYWYFELLEMLRKLFMTAILVFVSEGSVGQILAGLLVTFLSLLLAFSLQPYGNPMLNRMHMFALASQCGTLQYGLVLFMDTSSQDSQEQTVIEVLMVILSVIIFFIPILDSLLFGASRTVLQLIQDRSRGDGGSASTSQKDDRSNGSNGFNGSNEMGEPGGMAEVSPMAPIAPMLQMAPMPAELQREERRAGLTQQLALWGGPSSAAGQIGFTTRGESQDLPEAKHDPAAGISHSSEEAHIEGAARGARPAP